MDVNPLRRTLRLATVVDWIKGNLTDAESARLTQAVEHDAELRDDVAWVRGLSRVAEALPLVAPPPVLRQRLGQQFSRWVTEMPESPAQELVAALIFDSRHHHLELSMRGGALDSDPIHVVWRTEEAELVVEARAERGRMRIDGQVLPRRSMSSPVFEATATGPGFRVSSVDGDEGGRFQILVPSTVSELSLTNGEITIVAPIDLADQGAP